MKRLLKECYGNLKGRRERLREELDREWPRMVKFGFIFMVIVLIAQMIISFSSDETLKIDNSKRTEGTIVKITNIRKKHIKIRRHESEYKTGILTIKYEVGGTEYFIKEEVVEKYTERNKLIGNWQEGDKVRVVYNKENPYEAVKDETKLYEIFIYIILGIIILVYIDIGIEKLREKMKNKMSEKVEKTIK